MPSFFICQWVDHAHVHAPITDGKKWSHAWDQHAIVKSYGSYLTTRNHRSVLVGDANTLIRSSSICSLTSGSKKRRPSPKRTGTMPIWISSTSPARRHC